MKIDTIKSGGQSQGGLDNAGGTLSGPLLLSRDPQVPMEAATKRYVDTALSNLSASNVVSGTLPIARLPAFSGDITSEAGSNNMVLSNTGIALGEYGKIVVDAKGRATNGTGLGNSDIPNFSFNKIVSDKPTTLEGYGITDGISVNGGTMTGGLNLSSNPSSNDHLVPKQYVDGMTNSLSSAKTGDIVRKAYASTPSGFLKCNGAEVSKTTYADLYAIVGESNNNYNVIGSGQPWRQQYEINNAQSTDLRNWTSGTSFPTGILGSQAIVTKNRVYMIGGANGASYISTVYTAPINADGTLGSWSTSTSLPSPVGFSQAIVTKNRVYLLGGYNGTSVLNTVYTAPINADGTLGTWVTDSVLPVVIGYSSAVVVKNRVYLLGGWNGAIMLNTIYTASINSDGTLGAWSISTNTLPVSLDLTQVIIIKNYIYLVGGNSTADGEFSNIFRTTINNDGTLGTWITETSLPIKLGHSQSIVTKNCIYLFSGYSNNVPTSVCYIAKINSDGTLGSWSTSTSLPSPVGFSQAIATKNYVYLVGGTNGSAATSNVYISNFSGGLNDYSPYYAEDTINYLMPGSGRPWQQQYQINTTQTDDITGWGSGTALPGALGNTQAVVTKNRVYLLGGNNGATVVSTVYTAPINADGTLGTWTTTTALPSLLASSCLVVTKNKVYLLGGNNGTTVISTVYIASINADGTLGTWSTGTSLPGALSGSQAIVTKNRVYLISGYATNVIYTAPINTDGTLGTWSTGAGLPVALHNGSVFITKNRLYYVGGATTTTAQSTVYSASINSDGLLGLWNTETSFPVNIYNASVFVTKNIVYIIGGSNTNSSTVTASVYRSYIKDDGTLGPWIAGTSLQAGFCSSSLIVVKNKLYNIGGYNGTSYIPNVYMATISADLNDYSAYYDGSITPLEPVNPSTVFKLPDMSATDVNGIYHYIKF